MTSTTSIRIGHHQTVSRTAGASRLIEVAIMRKNFVRMTTATIVLAGIVGYWFLSGVSREGKMTHDPMAAIPSQHPGESWRYKAGQLLLPLFYSHDTQYAVRYREEAFRAVRPGATEEEIRTALGDPLDTRRLDDGRFMWYYTRPGPKTGDFWVRIVEFDAARR